MIHRLLTFFLVVVLAVATVQTGWADQTQKERNGIVKTETTIKLKNYETITTVLGDRYKINDATMIIGMDGEQVHISQLLVPCDAEVMIQNGKWVHTIKVLKIHQNASRQMTGGKRI